MKKGYTILLISLTSCLLPALTLRAQNDERFAPGEGEIEGREVIINKDLEIELPETPRNFEKISPISDDELGGGSFEYSIRDVPFQLEDLPARLRILKIKEEPLRSYSGNYLRAGIGNYVTPYFDLGLNSNSNASGYYGMHLRHLSSLTGPVDDRNSGDSHNLVRLYGKHAGTMAAVSGDIGYQRDKVYFYGYDAGEEVNRDTLRQVIQNFNIGGELHNAEADMPLGYKVYGRFNSLSDRFSASELRVRSGVSASYTITDPLRTLLDFDVLYLNYQNPERYNRLLVRMLPAFEFTSGYLTMTGGIRVAYSNDTTSKADTRIFPHIKVDYELLDELILYGVLDGDVEEVSLSTLLPENPYLAPGVPMAHNIKSFELKAGAKGNLWKVLAYDAGISLSAYKSLYLYQNNWRGNPAKFDVLYGNGSVFSAYANISYSQEGQYGAHLNLRMYGYNIDDDLEAYHRPNLDFNAGAWYLFYEKVKLSTDLLIMSGIAAQEQVDGMQTLRDITLGASVDWNIGIDYYLSDRYGAFLKFNNILNNNYQYFHRYPSRGLLVMAGVSVNF
jgi:hypothetical protein